MGMRLNLIVEGQTEETFVNRVLAPHLGARSVWGQARCVMTSRRRRIFFRGGLTSYALAKRDIQLWLKEDQNSDAAFSTMFDLYALPSDFPDYAQASRIRDPFRRVEALEAALDADINDRRFIPYIQLHEFEALVLTDAGKLDWEFIDRAGPIASLVEMAASFPSPEHINDGQDTAPSKRIIMEIPEYEGMKASAGPLVADKIGLPAIRQKCKHFADWLARLEALGVEKNP
jgi:hypothetical protein